MNHHSIEFVASGRGKARCPADPNYPEGISVDISKGGQESCTVDIPYPAKECGHFVVRCQLCKFSAALTAAGRADDRVRLKMPCEINPQRITNH